MINKSSDHLCDMSVIRIVSKFRNICSVYKLLHHPHLFTPLLFIDNSLTEFLIEFLKYIHSFRKFISINFLLWFTVVSFRDILRRCHDLCLIVSLPKSIYLFFKTFLQIFNYGFNDFFGEPFISLFKHIHSFCFDRHQFFPV